MTDAEIDDMFIREIGGALKSTIDAHGPITLANIGSAAKRIAGTLMITSRRKSFPTCGQCFFCGEFLVPIGSSESRKTIDHLTPRCRGGGIEKSNLVDSCLGCNNEKGRLTLEEYRAVIEYRRGERVVFWGESPLNQIPAHRKESLAGKLTEALYK